jgi:hypothetical protein
MPTLFFAAILTCITAVVPVENGGSVWLWHQRHLTQSPTARCCDTDVCIFHWLGWPSSIWQPAILQLNLRTIPVAWWPCLWLCFFSKSAFPHVHRVIFSMVYQYSFYSFFSMYSGLSSPYLNQVIWVLSGGISLLPRPTHFFKSISCF